MTRRLNNSHLTAAHNIFINAPPLHDAPEILMIRPRARDAHKVRVSDFDVKMNDCRNRLCRLLDDILYML